MIIRLYEQCSNIFSIIYYNTILKCVITQTCTMIFSRLLSHNHLNCMYKILMSTNQLKFCVVITTKFEYTLEISSRYRNSQTLHSLYSINKGDGTRRFVIFFNCVSPNVLQLGHCGRVSSKFLTQLLDMKIKNKY